MSNQEKDFYEFGPFRLDPVRRRLLRKGKPVPLTPKAFDTLLELVRQSRKTIEKDDLMREVWPDAVVEENNLNQNISALRKSLGDSRQDSQYIATIPGSGYRFVAEVRRAPFSETEVKVKDDRRTGVVEKRVESTEDKQIEKTESQAVSAENPAAVTIQKADSGDKVESLSPSSSGEAIVVSLKRHRRVAALLL